jgi:hypothetical protein
VAEATNANSADEEPGGCAKRGVGRRLVYALERARHPAGQREQTKEEAAAHHAPVEHDVRIPWRRTTARHHVRKGHEGQDADQQPGRDRHDARRRTTRTGAARLVPHY